MTKKPKPIWRTPEEPVTTRLCECGCGFPVTLAVRTHKPSGAVKGQPLRFINGHQVRSTLSLRCPSWGKGVHMNNGYVELRRPDHPKATQTGYVREHILVVEEVLGRALPPGAVIHHVNEHRGDNRKANLVVCQDSAYHLLLHQRLRAFQASGHADWRKCPLCKTWDDPTRLERYWQTSLAHRACKLAALRDYRRERREKALVG